MKILRSPLLYIICMIFCLRSEQCVISATSWTHEVHYQYIIESEIRLSNSDLHGIEEASLGKVFSEIKVNDDKQFKISEIDTLPNDKISHLEYCNYSESSICYVVDGAMTITFNSETINEVTSKFYLVLKDVLNDESTFDSVLPVTSRVLYVASMESRNKVVRYDKDKQINLVLLLTIISGGLVSVLAVLGGLVCCCPASPKSKKAPHYMYTTNDVLGIAAASHQWLETKSTSSSLSFESTILPAEDIDHGSVSDSIISDITMQSSEEVLECRHIESKISSDAAEKLEKIEEIDEEEGAHQGKGIESIL
mmetsp:Transcript_6380/g.8082  ORF Transcript_6380/g.8082 Transcript_6380/m.8082 type:complete len:309 (+) Transcript_6380:165-1091(+)